MTFAKPSLLPSLLPRGLSKSCGAGRSMTPRLELEPPEKIAPSTVVTARTATFSRKEGSSVEKHRYGSLKRHDQLLAAVKKTMAAHPGMGTHPPRIIFGLLSIFERSHSNGIETALWLSTLWS